MTKQIIEFIRSYIPLSEEEVRIIEDQELIRAFKKDTVLMSEGDYAKECFFILKGCIRSYYVIDGEEKTTEFYTENQSVIPVSYARKQPSEYYLSCLEDCVVALGSPERNQKLMEQIPKLGTLILQMNSELLVQKQVSFDNFKNLSPEMRYLHFMESRPDLFNRVPLYHLATYLGITPVSLSRLRKRVASKKNVFPRMTIWLDHKIILSRQFPAPPARYLCSAVL